MNIHEGNDWGRKNIQWTHNNRTTTLESTLTIVCSCCRMAVNVMCMGGSRGGAWDPDPLKNHKNIAFFSNTGPEPLMSQAIIQCKVIIGPLAKRHLFGVSLAGRLKPTFCEIWILFHLII